MSKANPLGLIGQYGYSDDDSDDEELTSKCSKLREDIDCTEAPGSSDIPLTEPAAIQPAPIPHCPWSACYDESSGYTYYWNQDTNAVTWEPPPEYLLALKLARQHLQMSGNTEVSAEEWQMYQQALAEKEKNQNKSAPPAPIKQKKTDKQTPKKYKDVKKRKHSDSEDEKIELITSYQHSDSDSNDEPDTPVKTLPLPPPKPDTPKVIPKTLNKKPKTKHVVEFGPALPPNQTYIVPIGPELPPNMVEEIIPDKTVEEENTVLETQSDMTKSDEDEKLLLKKLKYKTKLLERLGGEVPTDVKNLIKESPKENDSENKEIILDSNVDDLLESIEKTEMNKKPKSSKIDMFDDKNVEAADNKDSASSSPKNLDSPKDEPKPLFPSSVSINEEPVKSLFPSASNIVDNGENNVEKVVVTVNNEKKNIYVPNEDTNEEPLDKVSKKKLRISNSVLPEKKQASVPSYTTKYAQFIDGFSSNGRTGLGFDKNEDFYEENTEEKPKTKVKNSFGITSMFTKGETLNEKEDLSSLENSVVLVAAKLKFLNDLQTYNFSPVQEMAVQMQTLQTAYKAEALSLSYWRQWIDTAADSLLRLEGSAAPSGWTCTFHREQGRYEYRRDSDGFVQTEYPSTTHEDMDICTTPPPPEDIQEEAAPVKLPLTPPPPPSWSDPPPPGTDVPPPPPVITDIPKRESLGDELQCFYNDIAEIEKQAPPPPELTPRSVSPPPQPPPPPLIQPKLKEDTKSSKRRRIKISSIASKNKTVSNMVAKWQQVAEEIHSD